MRTTPRINWEGALRNGAKPCLCGGVLPETGPPAQARGSGGDDHRVAAERHPFFRRTSSIRPSRGTAGNCPLNLPQALNGSELERICTAFVERVGAERFFRPVKLPRFSETDRLGRERGR